MTQLALQSTRKYYHSLRSMGCPTFVLPTNKHSTKQVFTTNSSYNGPLSFVDTLPQACLDHDLSQNKWLSFQAY